MKNLYKKREFVCIGCDQNIVARRPKNKLKYCSLECYRKSKRPGRKTGKEIKCYRCGKKVYKPKNILDRKNERYFCSHLCANNYQKETDDKIRMEENGVKSIISQLKNNGLNK